MVAPEHVSLAGLRKVAEGREAEMYHWGDGRLLRLLRPGFGAASLERELLGSKAAAAAGVRVPAAFERVTIDGRPGVVVERLPGPDLLSEVASAPWTVWSAGAACGALHAQINAAPGVRELPELRSELARQIHGSQHVTARLAGFAIAALKELPEGDRLTHNDFHPGNVMRVPDGLAVIDWPNAMRGDPHADFARTVLMLKLGEPPPGSSRLVRIGARFLGRLLRSSYERRYRRTIALDDGLLQRWLLVRAIHRLQDGIPEERERIVRFVEARIR